LRRMHEKKENIFYYITTMNENYSHPEMPKGCEDGILKGMYRIKDFSKHKKNNINNKKLDRRPWLKKWPRLCLLLFFQDRGRVFF